MHQRLWFVFSNGTAFSPWDKQDIISWHALTIRRARDRNTASMVLVLCKSTLLVWSHLMLVCTVYVCLLHSICMFVFQPGESSHLALNKLKCPHCNYIAKHRRTLKRHLIIHSGVRSFSCDICGKLFTRREHVKRHSLVSSHTYRINTM